MVYNNISMETFSSISTQCKQAQKFKKKLHYSVFKILILKNITLNYNCLVIVYATKSNKNMFHISIMDTKKNEKYICENNGYH